MEQCDSGGGAIVGGGKRTKMQTHSKPVTAARSRGRQQHISGVIDKQKFYGGDQLTRPPLASHSRRRPLPANHQICKLLFFSHLPTSAR